MIPVCDRTVRGSVNMVDIHRKESWVSVSGKWTRMSVIVVIFFIPGNPGNDGLYVEFGRRLVRNLVAREERLGDRKLQYLFYTISNLNHVLLPPLLRDDAGQKFDERFSLSDQVQHKLDFAREYLPRGLRVYMIGHSIGSYMLLSILPYIKDDFNLKKSVCLFPRLERVSESPHGIRLKKVISTLTTNDWLAKSISFWLDVLPERTKRWLIRVNLTHDRTSPEILNAISEIMHMHIFRNIIRLFNDELENLGPLDENLLFHKEMIYFYYGTNDGWCPLVLGENMKKKMSRGHVIIDDSGIEHAFVLRDSGLMAEKMLQFIV
ncbi:unnamed protein product [Caenorhabditis bovis]|uniref:Lipid droplet-associated hydrolase n=1 Tax=Caenorhabditis bovis TaxID=2654633 RepID=A0A8S1EQI9_9PELO|nr:unnamed protein product [Caenorhabditis bovis]